MRNASIEIRGLTVAQFPNPPLIVALLAAVVGRIAASGTVDDCARAIFYVALTAWAWEEAAHGVNWFRRALGVAALLYIVVSLCAAL